MIPGLDVTAIIVAAIGAAGGVYAVMQSRAASQKTVELERRNLDRQQQQDQWTRTDDIITRLEAEIERLDRALRHARAELETSNLDNVELRGRIAACELRIVRLKAIAEMLANELRSHDLAVPGYAV